MRWKGRREREKEGDRRVELCRTPWKCQERANVQGGDYDLRDEDDWRVNSRHPQRDGQGESQMHGSPALVQTSQEGGDE